jgi:hypothetical protein
VLVPCARRPNPCGPARNPPPGVDAANSGGEREHLSLVLNGGGGASKPLADDLLACAYQ